jgi:hypothetical protein
VYLWVYLFKKNRVSSEEFILKRGNFSPRRSGPNYYNNIKSSGHFVCISIHSPLLTFVLFPVVLFLAFSFILLHRILILSWLSKENMYCRPTHPSCVLSSKSEYYPLSYKFFSVSVQRL